MFHLRKRTIRSEFLRFKELIQNIDALMKEMPEEVETDINRWEEIAEHMHVARLTTTRITKNMRELERRIEECEKTDENNI